MATIHKESIIVKQIDTVGNLFRVDFDFTDDPAFNPAEGWKSPWLHASFEFNRTMPDSDFTNMAALAMDKARRPSIETTVENYLRGKFGVTVVRVDPTPIAPPAQLVTIDAITDGVLFNTHEVV